MNNESEKFTFGDLLKQISTLRHSEELFVYYSGSTRKTVKMNEFLADTGKYALILNKTLSSEPENSWVGLRCKNSKDWFALFFAILCTGHPVILLSENSSHARTNAIIRQSGLCALITEEHTGYDGCITIEKAEIDKAVSSAENGSLPPPENWAKQIAFVTSGTTGNAKIYTFTAQALFRQTCRLAELWPEIEKEHNAFDSDHVLQFLPLRHCFGLGTALGYLLYDYVTVFPRSIGILDVIQAIRTERIWLAAVVPAVWKGFLQVLSAKEGGINPAAFKKIFGPYFTCTICAGTRLETSLIQSILDTGISLFSGWGMTETGIAIFGELTESNAGTGYTGTMLDWFRGKLNDDGELLITGDVMHSARLKNGVRVPRQSEWFATGDIFRAVNNDYYFVGRSKSVLIGSDGENVYPEEIEEELAKYLKDLCNYCVFGQNERPVLLVSESAADPDKLTALIRDYNRCTEPGHRITGYYLTDQMPMTEKGESSRFYAGMFVKNNKAEKITVMKGAYL